MIGYLILAFGAGSAVTALACLIMILLLAGKPRNLRK